jgi:CheY-like chemotaxis protein
VPIRDAAGQVVRWFGTNTDVTAQREVEIALQRARDETLAASRAKDDFLAALSHELRTPLNPVLLLASEAATNPALPASVREDFETIRKYVTLEARLIDDLLDLTRIARGKLLLELEPLDVHTVLREALATVRQEGEQKQVRFELQLQPGECRARADAVRLQQVFWNVLKNAVKFTPAGGRVTVTTQTRDDGRRMAITIADTGIGMTPVEMARVFDAFAQGDHASGAEAHRFGGLGLGLAISRMVVELHGGAIRAESPGPGQGATFVVELPVAPAAEGGATGRARSADGGESPALRPGGGRILLVEDHDPTRTTLERLLARRQFTVHAASTKAGAVALLERQTFDLLVSDVGLPDGSGCDLMREHGLPRGLPGIALTGFGMERDVIRSREAGFATHLTKPVNFGALERAIASLLALRRPGP